MRARNGSVTSLHSNSSRHPGPSSASAPKFQTSAITLRGLTLEQAQWTLTSEELQSVVSKSIKDWAADPTAVRVLHPRVLHDQLGDEKRKLETQSIELRTNYKLAVRKRRGLATALSNAVELVDTQDHASLSRMMDELKELGDQMDRIAEELYAVTDQQMQLRHLEDVHHSSALGMALRKLNTSFIKHMQDNSALRHRIAELEAERDEGWAHAQEIAQELEAKDPNSGRAGKVTFARKASVRASKAGLRSPNRRRSQRSSAHSSIRSSGMFSPRSAVDDIPPVPPIPSRKSLGIITDLPFRSPGMVSDGSPSSEARALLEAQRELCDMLGISLDEFAPPRRRLSTSDVGATSASGSGSAQLRRNSLITTPARTKDEQRAYVLASIGMTPHEI
ncbi:hypothetical protein BXZ70DRAFT_944280 [Cristinia sonorae]|uniref:Uncharacterized protein n=1 Tax=Cristinia sonorae TaxID=1940300 RepID=A0A8K0XNP3_9AGAR|nr:hypothetical protein BXZ70DRAFT_944280 [Cristinia sonorae]